MGRTSEVGAWRIFDGWSSVGVQVIQGPGWDAVDPLLRAFDAVVERKGRELEQLIAEWDEVLEDLGRDPSHRDWETFRPLRLSREEDWADWLAHLLAQSTTGIMAASLFRGGRASADEHAAPREVEREVAHEGYRADVVVRWRNDRFTHLEVKIGDEALGKTFATSERMMDRFGGRRDAWTHFILLLSEQLDSWSEVAARSRSQVVVEAVSWDDVCVALRRALRAEESNVWKAWAWAFLGAAEQKLIGYASRRTSLSGVAVDAKLKILRRGLHDDEQP